MLESDQGKPFFKAIKGKVIAASVLAVVAIVLAITITYFSFRGLLTTVDQLASPNQKLSALQNLFQRITQLDQRQRAEAIKNPHRSYIDFLKESKSLSERLDTLKQMEWSDARQVGRLKTMDEILYKRNKLFLSYLKVKSDFIYNRSFSDKLDSLSGILANNALMADTNVRTTEKKIITTTYIPVTPEKDNRSVFSKLFGKKKEVKSVDTRVEVKEELSVKVDTVAVAQQDSALAEVSKIMQSLESDRRLQNRKILERELELINTNTVLMNQLLSILHEVEKEELALMRGNNDEAARLVNTSIKKIGLVMIVFLLGTAFLVFLILIDVARSNYYREQLIEAKEEAEQLGQVKQRFLANMSHEIRTPLQTIVGFSEQLKSNSTIDQDAISAIHTSSEHLLHIVNEVLDYSRIESGKFIVVQEPFQLNQLIMEVSAGIQMQAERKGLTFTIDKQSSYSGVLSGDAFRLRQILYNVLGNAVKFTEKGFVDFTVTMNESTRTVKCIFKIADSGIGMQPEEVDKVFHQFEQAHSLISSKYGGTGLGLSIVKALVEAQGGTVQVSSEFGKGSVFTIVLNFEKVAEQLPIENTKDHNIQQDFTGKVLLVDDDPLILRLCSIILEKYNVAFIAFQESEKVLGQDLADIRIALLDIRMPNISGAELCKALRKKVRKGTQIIALTAHVLPEEHEALLAEGFDDILTKPFREQMLVGLLGLTYKKDASPKIHDTSTRIDLSVVKKMTMGDDDLFNGILLQFAEETRRDVNELEHSVTIMDSGATREVVHKIAGRLGQMGAIDISNSLRAIEHLLDSQKELTPALMDMILNNLDHVKAVLDEVTDLTSKQNF